MSTGFVITLILCVITIAYWRMALIILLATVLALLLTGVNMMAAALDGRAGQSTDGAPATPGLLPDEPGMRSDNGPAAPGEPDN
jgi:hypothetical protein